MEYAISQDVDIINLSLYARTTLVTSVLKAEIQKAVDMGIVVIGAAGNDNADASNYVPGSVESAWIIGAANKDGSRLDSSNYGLTVDYNVIASSTSEATALFTGFVSAHGLDGVQDALNDGLIFKTDYKDEDIVIDETVITDLCAVMPNIGGQADMYCDTGLDTPTYYAVLPRKNFHSVCTEVISGTPVNMDITAHDGFYISSVRVLDNESNEIKSFDVADKPQSYELEYLIEDVHTVIEVVFEPTGEPLTDEVQAILDERDSYYNRERDYVHYVHDDETSDTDDYFKTAAADWTKVVKSMYMYDIHEFATGSETDGYHRYESYIGTTSTDPKTSRFGFAVYDYNISTGASSAPANPVTTVWGYCGQANKPTPNGGGAMAIPGSQISILTDNTNKLNALRILLMVEQHEGIRAKFDAWVKKSFKDYTPEDNTESYSGQNIYGTVSDERLVMVHALISALMWGDYNGLTATATDKIEEMVATMTGNDTWLNDMSSALAAGSNVRDIVLVQIKPRPEHTEQYLYCAFYATGAVTLEKKSANPDITNGNDCYNLAGAEYTFYATRADANNNKNPLGKLVTRENGSVYNSADITSKCLILGGDNTYYYKETKAPTNGSYAADPEVYDIYVGYNHTTKAPAKETVTDEPINDPSGIVIKKQFNGTVPEGVTIPPLTGTQFTVKYYDIMTGTISNKTPTRTWVFEVQPYTNSQGKVEYRAVFDDDYLVDELSDELYYTSKGNVAFPLGKYTIQETKAAPNYQISGTLMDANGHSVNIGDVFETTVTPEGGFASFMGSNELIGKDDIEEMSVTVLKSSSENKPLAGVVFKLEGNNGFVSEKTTDAKGNAKWENLLPGAYTLTEIKTVEGHNLLTEPITFNLPTTMTEEEADNANLDKDNPSVTYDPETKTYYIRDLTFSVNNDWVLNPPSTGGFTDIVTFLPLIGGFVALTGIGAYYFIHKRKQIQ